MSSDLSESVPGARAVRVARVAFLVALAAALPYLGGGPVWDDHVLLTGDLLQREAAGLVALWTGAVGGEGPASAYYRPVSLTAMALVGRLGWGALHGFTALLHAGSTGLLAFILTRGTGRGTGPRPARGPLGAWAALVFAVHPLASEALGWASALPDVMAVHLGLWSVVVARRSVLAGGLLVLLAGASKETGFAVLPCFVVAGLAPRRALAPWGLALGSLLAVRGVLEVGRSWSLAGKAELAVLALAWWARSFVLPWPLTAVRDLRAAVPGAVLATGLVVFVAILALTGRDRRALAGLALAGGVLLMALPPTLDGYLAAERYAYPALVGVSLWAAARVPRGRWLRLGGGVLVVAALGVHLHQAQVWKGDLPLFRHAARVLPGSSYAHHFLGVARMEAGEFHRAARSFERAIEGGYPVPQDRWLRIAALVKAGRPEEALAVAEAGPREGLDEQYLAWWARAAHQAGHEARARQLEEMLRRDGRAGAFPWFDSETGQPDAGSAPRTQGGGASGVPGAEPGAGDAAP